MFRLTATKLRATAIAFPLVVASAIALPALLATSITTPAHAQFSLSISFDNFHNQLAPHGRWSNHRRWGEVWQPYNVGRDFRPYYDGYWADTREYGWLWVSNESWGDIPYHYGRWVFEPRDGWLWVPGYVWGPSWVVWREGGGNIGWFPMPPGDDYYGDGRYRDDFDSHYGYRDLYGPSFGNDSFMALWIFVGDDHFRDRNYRNYTVPYRDYDTFISQTTNTTNYVTINNYVVNRSVDRNRFRRTANERAGPVSAESVIGRRARATEATAGRQVEQRERERRPIPASINREQDNERDGRNQNSNARQPDQGRRESPEPRADQAPRDREERGADDDGRATNGPRQLRNGRPEGESEDTGRGDAGRENRADQSGNEGERANAQAERVREPRQAPRGREAPDQNSAVTQRPGTARNRGNVSAVEDDAVGDEQGGRPRSRANGAQPRDDADERTVDQQEAEEERSGRPGPRRAN